MIKRNMLLKNMPWNDDLARKIRLTLVVGTLAWLWAVVVFYVAMLVL